MLTRRRFLAGLGLGGIAMLTSRRLLITGGSGSFTPPPGPSLRTLAADPHGGWDAPPDPKAHHYNGKTYLTWFDGGNGRIEAAAYDHATETMGPIGLVWSAVPYDDHNTGCLMRKADGTFLSAFSVHNADLIAVRLTTTPEDVTSSAWGSVVDVDAQIGASGGGGYTYLSAVQLRDVAGQPIYLFFRDRTAANTGRIAYTVSTDGGSTWGAKTLLFTGATGNVPYFRVGTDWSTRIDVFTTDTAPGNVGSNASLYHFWIDGTTGDRYQTDGTLISAALPLAAADVTLVESGASGACWAFGASRDSGGRPACVVMRHLESPVNDNDIQVARWTGAAWSVTDVTTAGGLANGDRFASGAAINHELSNTIYCSRLVGGAWEVFRYATADNWATWTETQLTSGSTALNWLVECPHEQAAGLAAVWPYGTFVDFDNYHYATRGWG